MAMMVSSAFHDTSHLEGESRPTSWHSVAGEGDAHRDLGEKAHVKEAGGVHEPAPAHTAVPAAAVAHHSDNASSLDDHVVEKPEPAVVLTRRQKAGAHCRRFWLWYLIGSIIFLAILLPIVFKVIVPAIVQAIVNQQGLPIQGGSILALSPTALLFSLKTSLNTPLPATIDPLTLFLYNQNTQPYSPFLNLTLPGQYVNGATDVVVTNQTVGVTNHTELVSRFGKIYDQETVQLSVRGDGSVHLGALQSNVHLDKTIELKGLQALAGFGIVDLALVMPPDAAGNNLKGSVSLPNHSVLTLGLGNITLNLFSGPVRIGAITVFDVLLAPGNNTRSFAGQIYLDVIIQNFATVLASQTDALNSGNIRIDATGNATVVNGQHIGFVEEVLNNRRLVSTISAITLVGDVLKGFVGGQGNGSIVQIFTNIFGNSTFLGDVLNHWNQTAGGGGALRLNGTRTGGGSGGNKTTRRGASLSPRNDMAWQMLKLGMKMHLMDK